MNPCKELSLTLPLPPTINSYYQYHGHRRYIGSKGLQFKKTVAHIVSLSKANFGSNRLSLYVTINFADRRKADISNRIKALEDALCQAGLFEDDSQIDILVINRGQIIKGGSVLVTIKSID